MNLINWLKKESLCHNFFLSEEKKNYCNFMRTIDMGVKQLINISVDLREPRKAYVNLIVGIDIAPVLYEFAVKFKSIKTIKGGYSSKKSAPEGDYFCRIQHVIVLEAGFQSPGWPGYKLYDINDYDKVFEKDFHDRFIPWFSKRSNFEQLIILINEGDILENQEIKKRFIMQKENRGFFIKFFKQKINNSDLPSDGVVEGPMKNCLLGALFYAKGDVLHAKKYMDRYQSEVPVIYL